MKMLTSESKTECEEDARPNADVSNEAIRLRTAERFSETFTAVPEEGLAWMMGNEKTAVKGGILADEMGMGKTIQAVSQC